MCSNCQPNRIGRCENQEADSRTGPSSAASVNTVSSIEDLSVPSVASNVNPMRNISASAHPLPPFLPLNKPNFRWSESVDGQAFVDLVVKAYEDVVHWRQNVFSVPSGKTGKEFVGELARLFRGYGESSALEAIALKAAMVFPPLLLQKPHPKAKTKDHIICLERRMALWHDGNIAELLREGKIIQQKLISSPSHSKNDSLAKSFARLMKKGKVKTAMRLLSSSEASILSIHDETRNTSGESVSVLDELISKHPARSDVNPSAVLADHEGDFHHVVFDCIDAESIRNAALRTNGSAGPSGVDAQFWKRICSSFQSVSDDLCSSLALVARKIASTYVDPEGLASLTACRLIALDKKPGVRPIGIGEVSRRIICKAIISVIQDEIKEVAGTVQLCAGQEAGCEAGVHAMRDIFEDPSSEGALFVDATNAFNLLNRQTALLNIHALCPSVARVLTNTYRNNSPLFIEGETLLSCEGTTQGDPLAAAMYAIGVLPLIRKLNHLAHQLWFADDASAGGHLTNLLAWWEKLNELGPAFGYYPNASKTWLVVKDEHFHAAQDLFNTHGVKITTSGHKHLGSAIGDESFLDIFLQKKVQKWTDQLHTLSEIAQTEPHVAYCGFIHGLKSSWNYLMRSTPCSSEFLAPIEAIIRNNFIPALTGRSAISDVERELMTLPCRLGGLGIPDVTSSSPAHFQASKDICSPMVSLILQQQHKLTDDTTSEQKRIKVRVKSDKRKLEVEKATNLNLPDYLHKAVELAQDKGSSSWLTTLPLEEHGFFLTKSEFRDALSLRYGWLPDRLPSKCVCSESFTVDHALSCPRGAFPTIRHNELRNLTGILLTEVCHDVSLEPPLQPLTGEVLQLLTSNRQNEARVDIAARDFWGTGQKAFFDVKVFNPYAKSNQKFSLASCFNHHEKGKKRAYEQRILEVEHGSFTPLVFSTTGSMGRQASIFYSRLAHLLAEKRHQSYGTMMGWLRCRLSFSLLRSSILCIRGSRSRLHHIPRFPACVDLVVSESRVHM